MSQFSFRAAHAKLYATALVTCGLVAGTAHASPPDLSMLWFADQDGIEPFLYDMNVHSDVTNLGGGTWNYLGSQVGFEDTWQLDWDVTANANSSGNGAGAGVNDGAFVTASLSVSNTSGSVQSFYGLVTLALDSPLLGGTYMHGDVDVSISAGFTGATFGNISSGMYAGDPIYSAFIDGAQQHSLMDAAYSLTASPFSSNSDTETFGMPMPLVGPDAINEIAVWLKFELSPGDTATVVGSFYVVPIPAPASLPLLAAMGLFAGARRRRR